MQTSSDSAAVRVPADTKPAANLGLLILSGAFVCFLGFLIPDSEYDATYVPIILGLYVAGALLVRLSADRALAPLLLDAYGKAVLASSIVLLLGSWWALQYGDSSPAYLIDRFRVVADDQRVFERFILPSVGDSGISLLDGETNAPLHWWANVRLQNAFVDANGRTFPLGANLINVCIGAMTIAYSFGACHLALQRRRPDLVRTLGRMVRYCPWLLAASVLSIREIWVHCLFAATIFFGFRARELPRVRRIVVVVIVDVVAALAALLLRPDMIPVLLPLAPLCAWAPIDRTIPKRRSAMRTLGIVAAVLALLGGLALLEPVQTLVINEVQQRALKYIDFSKDDKGSDESNQDTLIAIMGDSILLRGVILSGWIWEQPLPKVVIKPGSIYVLGRQLMPLWLLALVYVIVPMLQQNRDAARQWWRTYRWLLISFVAATLLVGFTSGEGRHVFNLIPVLCVLLAGALATCPPGDPALGRPLTSAWNAALVMLVVSALFTLLVFGANVMFPRS